MCKGTTLPACEEPRALTLHPTNQALNPESCTLHPTPQTPNRKPQTQNPEPQIFSQFGWTQLPLALRGGCGDAGIPGSGSDIRNPDPKSNPDPVAEEVAGPSTPGEVIVPCAGAGGDAKDKVSGRASLERSGLKNL